MKTAFLLILAFSLGAYVDAFSPRLRQASIVARNSRCSRNIMRMQSDLIRIPIELSLSQVFDVASFLSNYDDDTKIQGVYAISDSDGAVKYVGSSLKVSADVRKHRSRHGEKVVSSVRVQTFAEPNPEALEAYKLELIRITSPSGNLEQPDQWEDKAVIRETEKPKASIPTPAQPSSSATADSTRLTNLQQKLVAAVDEVGKVSSADDVVSPFQEAETTSEEELVIRPVTAKGLDFTIENIDTVLDEIRPYLIADGGNVAIVSIDEGTRSIQLALQGACGSCPSSTTTMKMGIERVLKENFAYLGAITAIDPAAAAAALSPKQLDPEKVKDVLDKVLPAIKGMGGIAELDEIVTSTGVVKMKFKGPARLKKGVELALKDVEYVTSVVFDDA